MPLPLLVGINFAAMTNKDKTQQPKASDPQMGTKECPSEGKDLPAVERTDVQPEQE